jgi:membrane protein DedA with SNARE-associated domain
MSDPVVFLTSILGFAAYFRYPLVAFGTIIEGPILMIASGFMYRLGLFELVPLFLAILIGDLIGDVFWYIVGRYFAEPVLSRHGKFVGITPERFERIKGLFSKYHERILIFSKVTIGLGLALGVLVVAGATKVSFKKYMLINLVCGFFLVAIMLTIGYFFGEVYSRISDNFKIAFLVLVAVLILSFSYFFSRYVKRKSAQL